MFSASVIDFTIFLSTPSARRATKSTVENYVQNVISIHALREEGDANHTEAAICNSGISIHALREEGDMIQRRIKHHFIISIHALREEGDRV